MKRFLVPCLLFLGLTSSQTRAASFTPGNVVVLQCAGTSTGGNAGSLVEYAPGGGAPVQIIPLTGMVFGNTLNLAHDITLSADGALVIIPGYAALAANIEMTTAAANNRVIATVKWDGTVAYPIINSALISGQSPRGTTSDGFGNFWVTFTSGMRYVTPSAPTVSTTVLGTGSRACAIFNGQLYGSTANTVNSVSPNMPAGPGTYSAYLSSVPNANVYTFALPAGAPATGSTAYVGDYSGATALYVYSFNSGWTLGWTLTLSANPAHIAVDYNHASPIIYFTAPAANNSLLALTDPGASGTPTATTLATATGGAIFRGIAMAPTQPALPSFTVQPSGDTRNYGDSITFGPVAATGANPSAWTWKHGATTLTDGGRISGSTTTSLTISGITAADAGSYYAIASNNGGSTSSDPAVLALVGSCISPQLVSITNAAGTTNTFTAGVSACQGPIASYSWTLNNNPLSDGFTGTGSYISGSATASLTITNVQDGDAGNYTVTLIDGNSQPSSSAASLTVVDLPAITQQPGDQNKLQGATANFTVTATGGVLSYHWLKGAAVITNGPSGTGSTNSGATSAHLVIANVQPGDAGAYTVIVTNLAGSTTSTPPANLTVGVLPIVGALSASTNVVGSDAVFSASVSGGTPPLTYTWKHNGTVLFTDNSHIFGADTSTLGITNVDVPDCRLYSLSVSNAYGGVTVSALLYVIINTNQPNDVPNLIIYDPFNYPTGPTTAVGFYSWENIISIYNRLTGQPAFWFNTGGGLNSGVVAMDPSTLYTGPARNGGLYPWPGIDCAAVNKWTFAGGGNNNHLKFGGVTNGSVYFSLILTGDQGSPSANGTYDVIAGFTSGASDSSGNNANTWNYKLCTKADDAPGEPNPGNVDGPGGYRLGVFKGNNETINSSSVNGQFASQHLVRGHPYLVVGSYKFNSGGSVTNDDVLSLWVEPLVSTFGAAETNLPPPDAGGMITNWNNNAAITEFGIRAGLNASPFSKSISDLRIGKTWASVTGPYYPRLGLANGSPDVMLSWPAKDSFAGYGYKAQTSSDLMNWALDSNTPFLDGSGKTNIITETPISPQFWRLIYPPRSGTYGVY